MEKFVFVGSKDMNDNTELIDMLDGRKAAHGEEIELAEDEVEALKASGVKLRKVGDSESADEPEAPAVEAEAAPAVEVASEGDAPKGRLGSR